MFVLKYLRGIRVQLINKMRRNFLLLTRDIIKYLDVVEQSTDRGVISFSFHPSIHSSIHSTLMEESR